MPTSDPVLSLEDVSISYGHVSAVTDVTLTLYAGETLALIGPNGAGKSTLLRGITNQARKGNGKIRFGGRDISSTPTHRITRAGIVHVPEGRQVVAPLTVRENLQLAAHAAGRCPRREIEASIDRVHELFPPLARLRNTPSGLLSGGEQQMVAIGRALMARPAVLLLDEPSMGLAPVMVEVIYEFLGEHRDALGGAAVLLAEQSQIALRVADRAAVLSRGRLGFVGPSSQMDESLIAEAYLGTGRTAGVPETA
ncbi:ABC transporter ATP-binding protein [Rhodococcus sp. ACS1]|uniref:Amino acid/amide ABC transporter ATP-binding protein 2, HAAT family n=2 Tax=Rhodococcus TaxID=1827 RepID=A0A1H4XG98_9NOCA|nr:MULTISPECIES: ABC transporter ATP-binding protein [Rhodococcus]PBC48216.1 ABC transporter ATP-binding protein [Rhodococcus sp. ACS1]QSE80300.1 ABC transporter ATP-binding protein [Rhodococcus koreensis]QYB06762.1 ABC transporter ATP-binding protein [Rhodococcus sp. USK10]SED04643.1 amino acid/amide ABC transporter ATP-binding protein 2, HAAT family [Rhodococcus koreensis]GCE41247.1 Branched-chain amino acid transport ATP-binding protein LivF [Rhodococcus wratislaviensis]